MDNLGLLDGKDNKISDAIKLSDIRTRFDSYVDKDCCTGFIVKDFDSMIPPPVPRPATNAVKSKISKHKTE